MVPTQRRALLLVEAMVLLSMLAMMSACGRVSWPPVEARATPASINPTTYTAEKPAAPATAADMVRDGASSYELVLGRLPDAVQYRQESAQWVLTLPTKDRIAWAADGKGAARLIYMLNADPLLKAGLKPDLLRGGPWQFRYPDLALDGALAVSTLTRSYDVGPAAGATGSDAPGAAFRRLLSGQTGALSYNTDLAHFILNLGGDRLEWSRDVVLSDEDINMVLLADPFLQAGVNIGKLDKNEWFYQPANQYRPDALLIRIVKL